MKKYSTSQRLKEIMKARQIRQVDILEAAEPFCKRYGVKLGRNDLSQYVSGKVEPGQEKLTILGMALNVSEAWLMGFDLPSDRNSTSISMNEDGSVGEFVELYKLLDADQQALIVNAIKGILSNQ